MCVCSDRQDEVVYYEAFESADDITEDEGAEMEELRRLQASARQLEARRGRITAKRSYLRNKRVCACPLGLCVLEKLHFCLCLQTYFMYECCDADGRLCLAPAGDVCVQPRSETTETSKCPQGLHAPAAAPGRRL